MLSSNKTIRAILLTVMVVIANNLVKAQLKVPFTPRYSDAVYGDFLVIGNNVLSTTATGSYTGSDGNHNVTTVFVDIDADNTTFNSSSANLTSPVNSSCVVLKKAFLYWAAADFEESNINNEPNWNYNQVKLMLPGASTYTTVTADNVVYRGRSEHFVNDPYACFKDITANVQSLASPFGKYQVANVRTKKGALNPDHTGSNVGTSGGWQIVFVYEGLDQQGRALLPSKYITVFDGYANVTSSQNNYNINIAGFQTPPAGVVHPEIVFGALEGDRDLTGDRFQIRNVANAFIDISTANRPADNFFNSRITKGGSDFTDRNPASTNTLGYDAGYFSLTNTNNSIITNGQTSAVFRLTSNQETYGLFMLGFSIDVWAPEFEPILQTSTPSAVNPGDTISYTFQIENNGNDDARNVVITRTLPGSVELVQPVTPLPAGVTYSYNAVTRVLSFFIQDGLTDVGDAGINISYKTVVKDQCYFLETSCPSGIDAQVLATYTGVQNTQTQTTLSSSLLTPCGLGNGKPNTTNLNQPAAAVWATTAGDLNRTVNCNDASALATAQSLFPVTNKCNFILNKVSGTFQPISNSCPVLGTYTNTWTFTDKCGRTSPLFSQIITVQDTTKPVFAGQLPTDITVNCDAVPAAATLSATDNCGQARVTYGEVRTNGNCANSYILTRTWTAKDTCNNTTIHVQTVTVQDTTKPVFVGQLPTNITVNCDAVPAAATLSATDNCGQATVSFGEVRTNGNCANSYILTRTWTAKDTCNNTTIHVQTVTVQDTTKPIFAGQLPGNITVNCDAEPAAATLSATDNCGQATVSFGEVRTNGNCANSYILTRTWTAKDTCNNTTIHVQTVTVQDTTKPVFAGQLPTNITVNCDAVPTAATLSATDNCGQASVTYGEIRTNGNCANNYILTRTWTAKDTCNNTTIHVQTVTVQDTTKPVFAGQLPTNITVNCDAVPTAATLSATDNCGQASVTYGEIRTNGNCANNYILTRTWTAKDTCNNTTIHVQTVTVQDTTKPVFAGQLPNNIAVNCDAVPTAATLSATDNCGQARVTYGEVRTNGNCANSYILTRTWTAKDTCNNTTIHVQTVTVQDTTKPVITGTPQNIAVSCASDVPQASITSVIATDNCAGTVRVSVADVISNQSCANKYTVTRTWTATDVCGNSSTSSQTITINDTIKPVFTGQLPGNITVNCNSIPAAAILTATDNCGLVSVSFNESTTQGGCTGSGGITRTWTARDTCGNIALHVQFLTVQDTTKPVITGTPQNITVSCASDVPQASITSVSATDNCTGTVTVSVADVITNQSCANRYTITRTWTATDACDNSSITSQTITVNDTIKPVFVGQLPTNITVNCDAVPAAPTQTATDNCGQATVSYGEVRTNGNCANSYILTRTWTAKDTCNNTTIHVQTVTVQDTTKPVFAGQLPGNITVNCDAVPAAATLSATDNCGQPTVSFGEVRTNGNCANSYILTRTWTAKDTCNNTTIHVQTVTVQDTTKPVFAGQLPANITLNCDAVPAAATLSATDNCGQATVTYGEVRTNGNCANSYILTRTWTAKDACNNATIHVQTVTVQDTTKPVFAGQLPANITVNCDAVPAAATLSATDNCGQATVTFGEVRTNGNCSNSFILTRTWTSKDTCNNTTIHVQTVTVQDTTKPVITGTPQNVAVSCASDVPQASITSVIATDNCAGTVRVSVADVISNQSCANRYTVTRTWTATDECGNSSTSSQTITVNDTIRPVFTGQLPGNITVNCNSIPAAATLTATDNCGLVSVSFNESTTQGGCTGSGGITRTWTARDTCGNIALHVQFLTVQDTTKPVITGTPQDITVSCASDVPKGSITSVSATDNCTGTVTVSVADVITNQSCANRYTVTRTWTATDACDNSSITSQTITVNDTIKPAFVGQLPNNITVNCDAVPTAATLSATDNCGQASVTYGEVRTNGNCANNYILTRTWTAKDTCNNTTIHVQTVTVQDTTKPVITGTPQNITVSCASDVPQASIAGINATDNCAGNVMVSVADIITQGSCANKYTVTRTWTATDVCGISSTATQTIVVNDTINPVFTGVLPVDQVVCAIVPNAPILTATDNCGSAVVTFTETVDSLSAPDIKIYTRIWTAVDQCANATIHKQIVTVNPIIKVRIDKTLCEGETEVIGGNAYGLTGIYNILFVSASGCDSLVTLNLTVNPVKRTNIDAVLCQGEQVLIGGQVFTTSVTNQIIRLTTSKGCDSIITLNLIVLNNDTTITNRYICQGDFVDIGGHIFTTTGTYYIPFRNNQCTGIVQLNLNVTQPTSFSINKTICEGETVIIGGQIFSENGTYRVNISNSQGCDSIITLFLTVKPNINTIINRTICNGESVTVGTQVFNTSGTYQIVFSNEFHCDSTVTLNLIVLNEDTIRYNQTICRGESVTVDGQVFTESGTYYIRVTTGRCTSVIELTLKVNSKSSALFFKEICEGEAIVIGNQTFTVSGNYTVVLQNSTGCDSIVTLILDVSKGGIKTQLDTAICFGNTLEFEGQSFSTSGSYQIIFPVALCRDTMLLNLTVNPVSVSRIDTAVCDTSISGGIVVGDEVFTEPGIYTVTVQNSLGCDSIITLNLRLVSCIPLGEEITIFDTLPVLTTDSICRLSLPPGNNNVVESCNGGTSGTATYGSWNIDAQTHCLVYTAGNLEGNDTLCFTACDTITRQCNTTTVIITVTGLPPLANDDCVETTEQNTEINIAVLENDTDPDQDNLFIESIVILPKYGTVTISQEGQGISYMPDKNYCGRDTLYYEVCDGDDGCDTAMVCIKVDCECVYPQVITPNNDGLNDYLFFPCISSAEGARLLVWHRWGLIVYEDNNYKNDWQGTLKGELLPAGTYWYSIEFKDPETQQDIKEVNYFMIIN